MGWETRSAHNRRMACLAGRHARWTRPRRDSLRDSADRPLDRSLRAQARQRVPSGTASPGGRECHSRPGIRHKSWDVVVQWRSMTGPGPGGRKSSRPFVLGRREDESPSQPFRLSCPPTRDSRPARYEMSGAAKLSHDQAVHLMCLGDAHNEHSTRVNPQSRQRGSPDADDLRRQGHPQ